MEYKDTPKSEIIKDMYAEKREALKKELNAQFDSEFLDQIVLSFNFFSKGITAFNNLINKPKAIETAKILIKLISELLESTQNDPRFDDMTIEEVLASKEFEEFLNDFLKKEHNLTTEQTEAAKETFYVMLQGKATNAITKVKTNNLGEQIDLLGNAEIKVDDTFVLRIKNYNTLKNGIPTTAYMLLDSFLIHFTEQPIKDIRI